jgi:hypothetical protein
VPGAAERFASELRIATEVAQRSVVILPCVPGQRDHRLEPAGDRLVPVDHDEAAERVVVAVGGTPPPCLVLIDLLPGVTTPRLWDALLAQHGRTPPPPPDDVLSRLPSADLRRRLARCLADEFAGAGPAVRESVAKLGLALLAPTFELTPQDVAKYQRTRGFPRWDTGPEPWTDDELLLLQRWFRAAPGDRVPHLGGVPHDRTGQRAVARLAAGTLDDHHLYTRAELTQALSPIFHNVSRLVRLLLDERLLEESNACYRTANPTLGQRRRGSAVAR